MRRMVLVPCIRVLGSRETLARTSKVYSSRCAAGEARSGRAIPRLPKGGVTLPSTSRDESEPLPNPIVLIVGPYLAW